MIAVPAECWFIRVHDGIPKDMKAWPYMGNGVKDLFMTWNGGMGIGEIVHEEPENALQVRRLTLEDWNDAIRERKEDTHVDNDEIFLLDWSAPGEWFIVITW